MARREYRMHQLLWHEIRRFWNQYPPDVQQKICELGWKPPRPSRDENEAPILTNDSGEDFFYMHRQLIGRVNGLLAEIGDPNYPYVEGWVHLPRPGDPDYPVPPPWFDPGSLPVRNRYVSRIKTDVVFEKHFTYWEKTVTDPVFLRSVSLGTLGALIDYFLVDPVRRRWAAAPGATRPEVDPPDVSTISTEWDDPRYDFLGDYYSMHVNPIHWRFVGWIDDRIEEWKLANGVFGNDFWKGTWVGILPDVQPATSQGLSTRSTAPESAAEGLTAMEELMRTIARTGFSSMRSGVTLDFLGGEAATAGRSDTGGHDTGGHRPGSS
jgi:hypothetical protein